LKITTVPLGKLPAIARCERMDDYYFVWVLDQFRSPRPQIWAGDQFDRPDWQLKHIIERRLLGATERTMRLDRLAIIYPSPV